MTTRIYLKYNGELNTAEFAGKLTHQQVAEIFKGQNFKPDDNRFMIVYKEG
jgi:hypothetical protein